MFLSLAIAAAVATDERRERRGRREKTRNSPTKTSQVGFRSFILIKEPFGLTYFSLSLSLSFLAMQSAAASFFPTPHFFYTMHAASYLAI